MGRLGRFNYNYQDHSLEMGIFAARGIMTSKKYNFDNLALEEKHFEKS